jgi:hypothetical protein
MTFAVVCGIGGASVGKGRGGSRSDHRVRTTKARGEEVEVEVEMEVEHRMGPGVARRQQNHGDGRCLGGT